MIAKLYENIQQAIVTDAAMLDLMGLSAADPVTIINRIEKRRRPQNLLEENLPLIAFYTVRGSGLQQANDRVYDAIFKFAVYTNNDVAQAFDISARLVDLFHGSIPAFTDVESFETLLVKQFEKKTDLSSLFCFTTVLKFSIVIDR